MTMAFRLDIDADGYHKIDRMSQSKLKKILDGVDVYKNHIENPLIEPTIDMKLGTAVHTILLEPHKRNTILKCPKFDRTTRKGKIFDFLINGKSDDFFPVTTKKSKEQSQDLFYEVSPEEKDYIYNMRLMNHKLFGKTKDSLVLDEESYNKLEHIENAFYKNEHARHLLEMCHDRESTYLYTYKDIDSKCRLDAEGDDFVVDLKVSSFVKNDDFELRKLITKFRYDFQGASYLNAVGKKKFYIIFILSTAPYSVIPVQLSSQLIDKGMDDLDIASDMLKDCLSKQSFEPNYKLRVI